MYFTCLLLFISLKYSSLAHLINSFALNFSINIYKFMGIHVKQCSTILHKQQQQQREIFFNLVHLKILSRSESSPNQPKEEKTRPDSSEDESEQTSEQSIGCVCTRVHYISVWRTEVFWIIKSYYLMSTFYSHKYEGWSQFRDHHTHSAC